MQINVRIAVLHSTIFNNEHDP